MAFDTKRHKTLKWLQRLSEKKIIGIKKAYNPYKGVVLCRFGPLYVTNGYILAQVDYPEFEHVSDDNWMQLVEFEDGNKIHLADPIFEEAYQHPSNNDLFAKAFISTTGIEYDCTQPFNPRLISECMKPFIINGISPVIAQSGERLEFSGHNREVSIRVLTMGERK